MMDPHFYLCVPSPNWGNWVVGTGGNLYVGDVAFEKQLEE